MSFWKWSTTAATNATADGSINWAEGQAPSSVNDSARAMMAAAAKFRLDVSGAIATGGTSIAYTVASNQVFDTLAHMSGNLIAFQPHATNGATVTLNVDGLGAKPLRSSPSVELGAGVLIQGTPYLASYDNADGAFYLLNFFGNPFGIAIGMMVPFLSLTPPNSSFILPAGQALSRTTYAALFALIGTTFGIGDGSTTFNVIDLRGRLPVAHDSLGVGSAGRVGTIITDGGTIVGTTIGSAGGSATHAQTMTEMPAHNHGVTDPGHTHAIHSDNNNAGTGISFAAPNSGVVFGAGKVANLGSTDSTTTGITINNAGSGAAMAIMPPSIIVPWILRVI